MPALQFPLLLGGCLGGQGSTEWWEHDRRAGEAHHLERRMLLVGGEKMQQDSLERDLREWWSPNRAFVAVLA